MYDLHFSEWFLFASVINLHDHFFSIDDRTTVIEWQNICPIEVIFRSVGQWKLKLLLRSVLGPGYSFFTWSSHPVVPNWQKCQTNIDADTWRTFSSGLIFMVKMTLCEIGHWLLNHFWRLMQGQFPFLMPYYLCPAIYCLFEAYSLRLWKMRHNFSYTR